MNVRVIIVPQEDEDVDATDGTGLTNVAYERLVGALSSAGFDIESGPDRVL